MMIKVFESNKDGKIEFSKADLEKLLNEIYKDGYKTGYAEGSSKSFTWTSPYLTAVNPINTTATTATNAIDDLKCALTDHKPGAAFPCDEAATISKTFDDIIKEYMTPRAKTDSKPHDVFEGLAKELNF
jgi:hypothetical protein